MMRSERRLAGDLVGRPLFTMADGNPSPPGPLSHKGRGGGIHCESQGILRASLTRSAGVYIFMR